MLVGLKRAFLDNKLAPWPKKRPELAKKDPKSHKKVHVTFLQGTSDVASMRAQEVIFTPQSGSPTTKRPELAKKRLKPSAKYYVLLCQETRQMLCR